jgi:hypothetical protein
MAGLTKVKGSGLATGAATDSLVGIDDNATSTAITIDASENVDINSGDLEISTHGKGVEGSNGYYMISSQSSGTVLQLGAGVGWTGGITFAPGTSTKFEVKNSGDVEVKTGNLVIGTSGKGIDFSADGNAAGMTSEVLDDYETGTWTPTINGYSGGSTQTYSAQIGNYTKIGNTVTAHFHVRLSAKGDISGNYTHLRGLPYNHSGSVAGTLNINIYYGLASARSWISGEAGGSSPTSIWLTTSSNSTATSYLNTSLLTDTFGLRGTLVYEI